VGPFNLSAGSHVGLDADLSRILTLCCNSVAQRIPERIIEKAVKGMLPRGRLGNNLFRHLKVRRAFCLPNCDSHLARWSASHGLSFVPSALIASCARGQLYNWNCPLCFSCATRSHHADVTLQVYDGPSHPHTAQQPQDITNQINLGPKAAAAARS